MEIYAGIRTAFRSMPASKGVRLFIYNQSTLYSDSESIDLPLGFEANIKLTRRITSSLLIPYSSCSISGSTVIDTTEITDHTYIDLFNNLNLTYRGPDCMNFCGLDKLLDKCKCVDYNSQFFNLKNVSDSIFVLMNYIPICLGRGGQNAGLSTVRASS